MNRENLKKLADYLATGNTAMRFNMTGYCSAPGGSGLNPTEHGCGTVACAVGHGPAAGMKPLHNQSWETYSSYAFGLIAYSDEWGWCFDPEWAATDNTPEGAAARINWLLDHGLPDRWCDQMRGDFPLCYRQGDKK